MDSGGPISRGVINLGREAVASRTFRRKALPIEVRASRNPLKSNFNVFRLQNGLATSFVCKKAMQRFVILGDFVRSRKIERRSEFAGILGSVLEELNARYRDAFQSPLQITKGIDEFSAVVVDPSAAPSLMLDLAMRIYPNVTRMVLVKGEIDVISQHSALSDGPVFHEANALILDIEKSEYLAGFRSGDELIDPVFGLLMHQCLQAISKWPRKTARIAMMKRRSPESTLQQLGSELGISHQAVSAGLRRSKLDEIELAESLFKIWLSRHYPKHLFTGSD